MKHRLEICTIVCAMNWGMDNLVSYSFYSFASSQTKSKPMRKHRSQATTLMPCEQMAIPLVHYDQTKIFELLLLGWIRWYPGFNRWPFPSPRTRHVKKLTDFFQSTQLFTQCISMLYIENLYYAIMFGFCRSGHKWLNISTILG